MTETFIRKSCVGAVVLLCSLAVQAEELVLDMTSNGVAGEALDGTDAQSSYTDSGITISGSFFSTAANPVGNNNATQFGIKSDASNNSTIDPGETATFTLSWDEMEVGSVRLKEVVFTSFYSTDDLNVTIGSTVLENWSHSDGDSEFTTVEGATRRWTPTVPISIGNGETFEVAALVGGAATGVGIASWTLEVLDGADASEPVEMQLWAFNQADGTQLSAVTNSVDNGVDLGSDQANMSITNNKLRAVDAEGYVGVNSVDFGDYTSGTYELSWTFDADFSNGPDGNSDLYGISVLQSEPFDDLLYVGLRWASTEVCLSVETGGVANVKYDIFNTDVLSNVEVRVAFDLDADLYSVYLNNNDAGEMAVVVDVPMLDGQMDKLRIDGNMDKIGANNYIDIDNLTLLYIPEQILPELTPEELYNAWVLTFDLGGLGGMLDDPDGDRLDNLTEYAFGGIPDNADLEGHIPAYSMLTQSGTNWLEYVYYERTNSTDLGLTTLLTVGSDLINTNWGTEGIEFVGIGAGPDGFNAVTNRIPTDSDDKQFIRLQLELAE